MRLSSRASQIRLEPCRPPRWARGAHAQTILAHLLPSPIDADRDALEGTRVEIPLPDGDRLVARYTRGGPSADTVLYLFHGIASDTSAGYMLRTAALGHRLGWDVYRVNHRGCGEGRGLARGPYHSGRAEDLSEAIRFGRARHPGKRHLAVGFSLSANALLLLLTGQRGEVKPDAAIAVNGPIFLERASRLLEQGPNRIYDLLFSTECRMDVRYRQRQGLIDRKYQFPLAITLREFDSIYTVPAGGFETREQFYESCSARDHLGAINVPTVMLTSKDDPFISYVDYVEAKLSPQVHLHVEEFGGHLGYLTDRPTLLWTNRWLDYALWEFMQLRSE